MKLQTFRSSLLLLLYCWTLVSINTFFVGDQTLYADSLSAKRLAMHESILHNDPHGGHWGTVGDSGVNIRILSVYLVEFLHQATEVDLLRLYKALDFFSLLIFFALYYRLLRYWFERIDSLLAISYIGIILPMTYHYHFFHPWDRISLVFWVLCIMAIYRNRVIAAALLLVVGTLVKYDMILLPLLYLAMHYHRGNRGKIVARTAILLLLTCGTYLFLKAALPGGVLGRSSYAQIEHNLMDFINRPAAYAPLLAFGVPALLAAWGFTSSTRVQKACCAFGVLLLIVFFLKTNFREIRAEMPALILIIPCALQGLSKFLGREGTNRPGLRRSLVT